MMATDPMPARYPAKLTNFRARYRVSPSRM